MPYPHRLIPKSNFELLDGNTRHGNLFIRHFRCPADKTLKELFEPHGGLIDPKCVADPRDHIIDYSVNLHGEFMPEDVRFKITQNKEIYEAPWEPGRDGVLPVVWDYSEENNRKPLFFRVDDIYSLNEQLENDRTELLMEHKPLNANYWHFTLNWLCEGELLLKKKKKSLLAKIRTLLQKQAHLKNPLKVDGRE